MAKNNQSNIQPQDNASLDECNVFVKYLPPEVDDKEFHRMFKNYGTIVSCKIMVDQTSGKSLGYGFVRYNTPAAAQKCIDAMNGLRVANKRLLCKLANQVSQSSTSSYNAEYGKNPVLTAQVKSDNLYIKPLLPNTTEDDLRGIFGKFGRIIDCKVMVDRVTGLSRQIGFVRFETVSQAQAVIDEMNGFRLSPGAPPLIIKFADTKEQKDARQVMRSRGPRQQGGHGGYGGQHQHPGQPQSPIPPMYYYYPQYGYPFAANPNTAGYNAGAYPYAAMASALGYAGYAPGSPGGQTPGSPMSVDPQSPNPEEAQQQSSPAQQSAARLQQNKADQEGPWRQAVSFNPGAANVNHNIN
jgi:RNA recognition motif-containing protein